MKSKRKQKFARFFTPRRSPIILLTGSNLLWTVPLLMIITAMATIFLTDVFHIQKILCSYNQRPCSPIIEAELIRLKDKNILLFQSQPIEAKLRQADVALDQVLVQAVLPHTVVATLTSKVTNITVATATDGAQLLIDEQDIPFKLEEHPQTPPHILISQGGIIIGEPITDPALKQALALVRVLREYFISFETVTVTRYQLQVALKQGIKVTFATDSNFYAKVPSLQVILRESTIQPPPKEIDLRFDKPVIH